MAHGPAKVTSTQEQISTKVIVQRERERNRQHIKTITVCVVSKKLIELSVAEFRTDTTQIVVSKVYVSATCLCCKMG